MRITLILCAFLAIFAISACSSEKEFVLDESGLNIGQIDTGDLKLKFGELQSVYYNGDGMFVVKAKIKPQASNKQTIDQNYHSACKLITDNGFNSCNEIQYWAVADMTNGSESKVISFTISQDLIQAIADKKIVAANLEENLNDLWILPSLTR